MASVLRQEYGLFVMACTFHQTGFMKTYNTSVIEEKKSSI